MDIKLLNEYKRRYYGRDKRKFREYVKNKYAEKGIEVYEDKSFYATNLYIGNKDADKVVMAHYDTPPNMAVLMIFNNLVGSKYAQFLIIAVMILILAVAMNISYQAYNVISLFMLGYLIVMFLIGNKYNYNDNTSGVLVVMECIDEMIKEGRDDILFVLTDNEEKGLFGGFRYRKFKKKEQEIIVVDCVGTGEKYAVISTGKNDFADRFYDTISDKADRYKDKILVSDNAVFGKQAVLISKVSYSKLFSKPIIRNMHTNKDRDIEEGNIVEVKEIVLNYFKKEE